jgi:hypothetical protein
MLLRTVYFLSLLVLCCRCGNSLHDLPDKKKPDTLIPPSGHILSAICDTAKKSVLPVKDYRKALKVWLEDSNLDWFLEYRQSAWRGSKVWIIKILPIDSNLLVKCKSAEKKAVCLYIPNHFAVNERNGEYIRFFIINNSTDTLKIPALDATLDPVFSSVAFHPAGSDSLTWLAFQKRTGPVICGNSRHTLKLFPGKFLEAHIESDYLNMGTCAMDYRLELVIGKSRFVSNPISISLMEKQRPYLGKAFD